MTTIPQFDLFNQPDTEEWRPIIIGGIRTNYDVSNICQVRRVNATRGGRYPAGMHMTLVENGSGYYVVPLKHANLKRIYRVHRLVLTAFVGVQPTDKPFVNHKDGDKKNNSTSNLEWVTCQRNNIHARELGLNKGVRGEQVPLHKLTEAQVVNIKSLIANHTHNYSEIARMYNVSPSCIVHISLGRTWKHITSV